MKKPTLCDLSADYVRSILDYNMETGLLTWKYRDKINKTWNSRFANKDAGSINNVCINIKIDGKLYKSHRIAWLIVTGDWPVIGIDHKDGNPFNNKFENLRLAAYYENNRNCSLRKDNKSGIKGVGWYSRYEKWTARIRVFKSNITLGYFDNIDDARKAREEAEIKYFGEFRRIL
jgi:hypothetical protein